MSRYRWPKGAGTIVERFWLRVEKGDGCWNWTGFVKNSGYGSFSHTRGTTISAHRFSYELHFGPVPDGMLICHHCDNKICVRPDHLFVGTPRENMRDMMRKGRADFGGWSSGRRANAS